MPKKREVDSVQFRAVKGCGVALVMSASGDDLAVAMFSFEESRELAAHWYRLADDHDPAVGGGEVGSEHDA